MMNCIYTFSFKLHYLRTIFMLILVVAAKLGVWGQVGERTAVNLVHLVSMNEVVSDSGDRSVNLDLAGVAPKVDSIALELTIADCRLGVPIVTAKVKGWAINGMQVLEANDGTAKVYVNLVRKSPVGSAVDLDFHFADAQHLAQNSFRSSGIVIMEVIEGFAPITEAFGPNPCQDVLKVMPAPGDTHIRILDLSFHPFLERPVNGPLTLQLNMLPAGYYWIEFSGPMRSPGKHLFYRE